MIPTTPAVYIGRVSHQRFGTVKNAFSKRLFLTYLDLDALPGQLDGVPWFSACGRALARFRERDFLDSTSAPLAPRIRDRVEAELGFRPDGPVHLLAHLRTAGWLFNPLAVYYCFDAGELAALVLEVTNTPWGQRHWYVLDGRCGLTTATRAKAMHVSPFFGMDQTYDFRWRAPGPSVDLRIRVTEGGRTAFVAQLTGEHQPLTATTAPRILRRYPLMPLRVTVAIYLQAVRLVAKGVRYYPNPQTGHRKGDPR